MFNKKAKPSKNALPPIQCAICGIISDKIHSFFCGSGHAVCKECQISDIPIKKNAGGDNKSIAKVLNWELDWEGIDSKNNLASGDHENKDRKKHKKVSKNKVIPENNTQKYLSYIKENEDPASYIETTIGYKNKKYSESKTSRSNSTSTKTSTSETVCASAENKTSNSDTKSCTRPVTCPEQNCSRIITMDSAMLHFLFDHSKLPRIQLTYNTPQQFLLKSSKLSMNTRCLALMTIQKIKVHFPPIVVTKSIKEDSHHDFEDLLLLMGVRMRLEDLVVGSNTSIQKSREGSTQSEFTYKESFIKELKPTDLKDNDCDDNLLNKDFDRNEALLTWVCKADDTASNYSITLLSGDKKHGHSFIGETISIRDPQDPVSMYHRSECCTLRGVAANRILDDKGKILVLVTILK